MKKRPSKQITAFLISACITGILVLLVLAEVDLPIITTLELKSRDLRFRLRGVEKPSRDVVVVAIDDRSIKELGRWPWPRSTFTKLIAVLYEGGARSIGFDLLFSEPEENLELQKIRELINAYTKMGLLGSNPKNWAFFDEMVEAVEVANNDALFSAVTREAGNVVFAMAFVPSDSPPKEFVPYLFRAAYESFKDMENLEVFYPVSLQGDLLPIPILAEAASELGFVNFIPDRDGAIRRGFVTLEHGGALFAPLAVRVIQRYLNLKNEDLILYIGKKLQLGPYSVPMDYQGMFHINYYGPDHTVPYYSFVDVLNGAVKPEIFRGKSVFIGGAAVGLGDLWPNPFVRSFRGVEIHATIADNILTQRFLLRPWWTKFVDASVVGALGLLLGLVLSRLPIVLGASFNIALIIFLVAINQYVFEQHRIILLWVYPLLEVGLVSTSIFFSRYFTEGREKRRLKGAFEHYMSPSVVNRVLKYPEKLALGGKKDELSVLFSDIRGFTSISERLSPGALVQFMNRYLTAMTDIIMEYEGTLDKYIGDAIMAIYGAPEELDDHAIRACRTAVRMMEILNKKREKWVKEGLPTLWIGIGINTGQMVVGNMGSERRFDYTVMGDNVNLASRLEGLSKFYGVNILISEFTQKKAKNHFVFRELDFVRVKGKERPVRIFELLGKDYFTQGRYAFISPFKNGLEAYRKQDWDRAIRLFEEVLYLKPKDNPATLFMKRCQTLKRMPPPKDWDGVYIAKEK